MADFVRLEYDIRELEEAYADMSVAMQIASVSALNKVGRLGNKEVAKDIKQNYNIKAGSLKIGKLVTIQKADARKHRPFFIIFIRVQGRGLMKYAAKKVKGGISVLVKKTPKTIRSAFITTWHKGAVDKFVQVRDRREGTYTPRGGKKEVAKRRTLFGPMVSTLYKTQKAFNIFNRVIDKNYQKILDEDFNKQAEKR